jgi:hypothetical protein
MAIPSARPTMTIARPNTFGTLAHGGQGRGAGVGDGNARADGRPGDRDRRAEQCGRDPEQHDPLPRVAEHHAEHQHVRHPGQPDRIDVGVRNRAVGLDQRGQRAPQWPAGHERGRLYPRRVRKRDHGAADLGHGGRHGGHPVGRNPAWQRRRAGPPDRAGDVGLELGHTGQQLVAVRLLGRVEVQWRDRQQSTGHRAASVPQPAGRLPGWPRFADRELRGDGLAPGEPDLHRRRVRDPDQHITQYRPGGPAPESPPTPVRRSDLRAPRRERLLPGSRPAGSAPGSLAAEACSQASTRRGPEDRAEGLSGSAPRSRRAVRAIRPERRAKSG